MRRGRGMYADVHEALESTTPIKSTGTWHGGGVTARSKDVMARLRILLDFLAELEEELTVLEVRVALEQYGEE